MDHASVEFLVDPLQQRSEGLLGPSVCPDAGDLLGLSPSILQGGLVDEVGCAQVLLGGNGGQDWRGQFSSAETSEEELKVPLNVAEHRGCGSPNRVFDADCLGAPGECVGRQAGVHGSSKNRRKNWVKKKLVRNYAVGEDLAWDNVLKMARCTLVGRVMGRNFAKKIVQDWAAASWGNQFGYVPVVEMLNRGWFAINLEKEEDFRWIQTKSWHIDHSPVLLKPWHPLFDASKERVDVIPIWVRLPAASPSFLGFVSFQANWRYFGDLFGGGFILFRN